MDNFNHKEYRGNLYNKLKGESDKTKRTNILADEKISSEYKSSEEAHKNEINHMSDNVLIQNNKFKNRFGLYFMDSFTTEVIEEKKSEGNPLFTERYKLFENRIKDSVLIDLGCGDDISSAYKFATVFQARKYIGVEKYPSYNANLYSDKMEYLKNKDKEIKSMVEKGLKLIPHEIIFNDMLDFLSKRTELSNFMINGVDEDILYGPVYQLSEKERKYFIEIQKNISRLVPKGGLVIGSHSVYLNELSKMSFLEKKELTKDDITLQIWEKV